MKSNKRTITKWAFIWPVFTSRTDDTTYWAFFEYYYEDQEYEEWNEWEEGVGDNCKTSWRCKKQYKNQI